jgi:glutathione synthase/RimK-type ligase-like ATP-grasp enzyme
MKVGQLGKKNRVQVIASKLAKTRIVQQSRELARHVPDTRRFSRHQLYAMLEQYRMVYVKPDRGSLGVGVMRIDKERGGYRYQNGTRIYACPTFQALYRALKKTIREERYLIQRGIRALRRGGCPFDFRIMVQRNPAKTWVCTGTAGRVAHPRKVVSNGSQGGTIYVADALLRPIAGRARSVRIQSAMRRLAILTALQFSRSYPAMNELGLDIAVDRSLRPWILEVNTRPDPCPFTKLDDTSAIRRIVRYAQAYGRSYCLACTKARKARKTR